MKSESSIAQLGSSADYLFLIGSSVYSPGYARDTDVVYIGKTRPLEPDSRGIDLIKYDSIGDIPPNMISSILAFGELLTGDEKIWDILKERLVLSTWDSVDVYLEESVSDIEKARKQNIPERKTTYYASAFNSLFDAARTAVQLHLNSTDTRWGTLKRELRSNRDLFDTFEEIIAKCHVKYAYEKRFPNTEKEILDEFSSLYDKTRSFCDELR